MCPERLELAKRESQLGIFVGEAVQILRRLLKVFHGVGGLGRNRLDDFKHLGCGFAQIGSALSSEHLAVFGAAGAFSALRDVNSHVAKQSELHQPRLGVTINPGTLIDLNVDAYFESGFVLGRSGAGVWLRRMNCRIGFLCTFLFFGRDGREQFLDLSDFSARQHNRRAYFDSGGVVKIHFVGHERPEKPGSTEQDENKDQNSHRAHHQDTGHYFISL